MQMMEDAWSVVQFTFDGLKRDGVELQLVVEINSRDPYDSEARLNQAEFIHTKDPEDGPGAGYVELTMFEDHAWFLFPEEIWDQDWKNMTEAEVMERVGRGFTNTAKESD